MKKLALLLLPLIAFAGVEYAKEIEIEKALSVIYKDSNKDALKAILEGIVFKPKKAYEDKNYIFVRGDITLDKEIFEDRDIIYIKQTGDIIAGSLYTKNGFKRIIPVKPFIEPFFKIGHGKEEIHIFMDHMCEECKNKVTSFINNMDKEKYKANIYFAPIDDNYSFKADSCVYHKVKDAKDWNDVVKIMDSCTDVINIDPNIDMTYIKKSKELAELYGILSVPTVLDKNMQKVIIPPLF